MISPYSGFPVGASVTLDQLSSQPYDVLAKLRATEPVSWVPALNGWLVTRRDLAIEAMRDDVSFTVDDPRFTTAAVLGPSMLSLDGAEHTRHRSPFAATFRAQPIRADFERFVEDEARRLVDALRGHDRCELRTAIAGPLAVNTIVRFFGLDPDDSRQVLDWHASISNAIVALTVGKEIAERDASAIRQVRDRMMTSILDPNVQSLLHRVQTESSLTAAELSSDALVIMFGAIETAEGMTANALYHLLSDATLLAHVRNDRTLVPAVVEESLRLEPAAAVVDRYATTEVRLGDVHIPAGDLVTISLLGANRDPGTFVDPDRFDLTRANNRQHVSFVQGPHGCLGLHLARLETIAAIHAVLDGLADVRLDPASTAPSGLVFRKADQVLCRWNRAPPPDSN